MSRAPTLVAMTCWHDGVVTLGTQWIAGAAGLVWLGSVVPVATHGCCAHRIAATRGPLEQGV